MSEVYGTEEEQIEAIKKWWKENGKSLLVGIFLAIGGVLGWQGWQKQQQEAAYSASNTYQDLLQIVSKSQAALQGEDLATAQHLSDTLKNEFSSSIYAQYAALYKAQFAVNSNDLDAAEGELEWVLAQSPSADMASQTHIRLASVLLAKENYEAALKQLAQQPEGYEAIYLELKGDIYFAQGQIDLATDAYKAARDIAAANKKPTFNNLLELKLQQLTTAEEV